MQQKMQQLEVQLMEAKLQNEYVTRLSSSQQRLCLTMLRLELKVLLQNLQSDTDQQLDFVEQESELTKERDLQKQGEQARSQGELKQIDHGLEVGRDETWSVKRIYPCKEESNLVYIMGIKFPLSLTF